MQGDENSDELVNVKRSIIKEKPKEHEKKINEISKSQLQNTDERLKIVSNEVLETIKCLELIQDKLDEELSIVKNDISKIKSDLKVLEDDLLDPNEVSKKLIELEDRFRHNKLGFDGLMYNPDKTWDDYVRKCNFEGNLKIGRCNC